MNFNPCECEYAPSGRPDPRDSYTEGETRIPNPLCPRHRDIDDMAPGDYEQPETLDLFGVAWSYRDVEWVEADGIDEETGEPYTEGD